MAVIRCFILAPTVVFAASVAGSSFSYPLTFIPYDTVTVGGAGNLLAGRTVMVGTAPGLDNLGRQRIRSGSTTIQIKVGRSSRGVLPGELNLSGGAFITVLDLYEVWSRPVYTGPPDALGEAILYKDGDISVADWTDQTPPVANAGPAYCATIDGSGTITVSLLGSASIATATGATISAYNWGIADGTLLGGYTLSSPDISLRFPPGFRYVSLQVTDSNGKIHTAFVPIFARDPAHDLSLSGFSILNHEITHEGQQIEIALLEPLPVGNYPDGTLVMIWDGEPTGGAQRTQQIFTGWHYADPSRFAGQREGLESDTTLVCIDVARKLMTLPGLPQLVQNDALPDSWTEMFDAKVAKYLHYLLHWHSTALTVADYLPAAALSTIPFGALSSDGGTLWEQVSGLAEKVIPDYRLTCNRRGQLLVVADPILQPVGSRSSTVQFSYDLDDYASVDYLYTRPPRLAFQRSGAILAGSSATVFGTIFCVAPGAIPSQGAAQIVIGEKLAIDQGSFNDCEGNRYARQNARYGRLQVVLASGEDSSLRALEAASLQWVRLTLPSNRRGRSFAATRGLVWQINIRYQLEREGMVREVSFEWEPETSGPAAITTDLNWIPS